MPASIAVVQRVISAQAITTTATATLSSATAGNKLVAVMKENGPNAVTTPSGFAHVAGSPFTIGTRQLLVMWKDAAGGETAITFSNADSNNKLLTVWEVSGLETGAEVYADTTAQTATNTTKTLDASGTLANADNFFVAVAEMAAGNGGSETVNGLWTARDTGSFDFWIVADLITSATTSLAPTFTYATTRQSGGFMAGWRAHVAETGTATLSGSGTLGATGAPAITDAGATLTGSGTLGAVGAPGAPGVATLSGSGSLSALGLASQDIDYDTADEFPALSVWEDLLDGTYGLVGSVASYEALDFEEKFLEPGNWEMTLPIGDDLTLLTTFTPDRYVTIDWRGHRTTWLIEQWNPSRKDGLLSLTVGGPSALAMLGWDLAWPDPSAGLNAQPDTPNLYGPDDTETVVRDLIIDNWNTRRGETLIIPSNAHQGEDPIQARGRFDVLLELVAKKAKRGGIGVEVGLENVSSARSQLKLRVWEPVDRSGRVQLSEAVGSIREWSQNNQAPTMTKALVGGVNATDPDTSYTAGRYKQVTTADSIAESVTWGGHRVAYVSGPQSYDDDDLTQAGEEALTEAGQSTDVALTATDAEGLMAFTHYNVGDQVTGILATGLDVVDVITSIKVSCPNDSYPNIVSTFGDPSADDEMVSMAQLIRNFNRRIRQLEQRSQ